MSVWLWWLWWLQRDDRALVTVAYNHHRFEVELSLLTARNPKVQCEDIFAQCADLFGLDPKHIKIGQWCLVLVCLLCASLHSVSVRVSSKH